MFARRRWAGLFIGFVCITVSTLGGLVIPRALGNGIDTVLRSGSKSTLVLATIIMGTTILRSAARFGDTYVTQLVSQQASYDIRNALYDHLQRMSFTYYDKTQTGQIMSRATADIEAARMFLSAGLLNLIQIVLVVVGVTYLLLTLDWRLALMTLAFMPLSLADSLRHQPPSAGMAESPAVDRGAGHDASRESFRHQGSESLFPSGKGKPEIPGRRPETVRPASHRRPPASDLHAPDDIADGRSDGFGLMVRRHQVIAGTLTIGGVTQFILYLGTMAGFVSRLGTLATMISRTISAGGRIFEILDTESASQ